MDAATASHTKLEDNLKMKRLNLEMFLGMEINQGQDGCIYLEQTKYAI